MGFAFVNRCVNPLVRALLASPLHPLLSRRLAVISVIGRRSGVRHTFPVGYRISDPGRKVLVRVGKPESKVWWRNLKAPAPVDILIRGERRSGTGRAIEDDGEVRVEIALSAPAGREPEAGRSRAEVGPEPDDRQAADEDRGL